MLRQTGICAALALTLASPIFAQDRDAQIDALYDALGLPEILLVMQEEGIGYGEELGLEMLGGVSGDWRKAVLVIYNLQTMNEEVRGAFGEAIMDDEIEIMLDFFGSDRGQEIIQLEVTARRAMLDEAVEEASKEASALQVMDETPRYLAVREFVETNDLIESNVVGALNSSYAFYMGLIDGGVMPPGVDAESALQDVWAQEPDIRANTTEWVYAFLLLVFGKMDMDG